MPYRRTGTLDMALNDAEMRALETTADVLSKRGVPAHLLDAAGVRAEEPQIGDGAIGGLLIETHGFVAAGELTRALAAAARRHGAQLIEQSRVRRIVRAHGEIVVETDRGSLTGNAVVLAAGSWSGRDRDRRHHDAGAGAAGARPAALARLDRHTAAARDLEQPVLSRSVGRWDAAGGGDGGGSGLRRAGHRGGRARSARRGVRDRAARVVGGLPRGARRACGRRPSTACR